MLFWFFKNTNLFIFLTKFLIIIMPFYVIIKVYFDKVLGLWFFGFFIKEFILLLLILILFYQYFLNKNNKKIKLKFDIIDYIIFAFIFYWIIITLINWLWIANIFYWWRYDFLWFIVFLIFKHWRYFFDDINSKKIINFRKLLNLFLLWWWISLFFWLIVKFVIWEEILSLFGFTIEVSEFWFWWWIPMYQWVEASWIRRFQWILDSPLAMGYYLILFLWVFLQINKKNIDFSVIFWTLFLFSLIFITYSRAAMLWVIISWFILFLLNFKNILKHFKKVFIVSSILGIIIISGLSYVFQDKINNVFLREWSTNWHTTRMITWFNRFLEKPFWAWLAESWPAYRSVIKTETSLETDRYYIPESWFVQILVEGGFIYLILFLSIIFIILQNLYKNNNLYLFLMFLWVLVMNMFLHVFEYTYITILLFMILGLFYRWWKLAKN